jgi:His/Glu/Gln/Arg/opine family amino acid ABC transporter permease subunit
LIKLLKKIYYFSICLFLVSCSGNYNFAWFAINPWHSQGSSNIHFLIGGLWTTIWISFVSLFLASLLGLFVTLPHLSSNKYFKYLNIGYVEIFRAIPVLVLLLWIYYGLPSIFGGSLSFNPFVAGVITLVLHESAFISEIYRSGIQAIKKGQIEAAKSLGLNSTLVFIKVTLPQAIRIITPALLNQGIYILKMSSLISVIGLGDLTRRANELIVTTYRPLEIYSFLVLEYLVLVLIASFVVRKIEKKFQIK